MGATDRRRSRSAEASPPSAKRANPGACGTEQLRTLFEQQRGYFNAFIEQLDYREVQAFVDKVMSISGVVIWTGVGKSAFVAKKVNQTLVSTGTRSMYLQPTDALHGDIGIVDEHDVLVMLSKSGDTAELTTLVPYAKAKGAFLVAITAKPRSPLAAAADLHVTLPSTGELQPFEGEGGSRQAPPATYNAFQMLFGDTVAVALMCAKGLSREEYAMNHPAGRIGKRLVLRVEDVMQSEGLPTVGPGEGGLRALMALSQGACGTGALLVVDGAGRLLGTLSDGDLRGALTERGEETLELSVMELMNFEKDFPRTTTASTMAYKAMEQLQSPTPVGYLPVVSADGKRKLLGVVTLADCAASGL